jgi:hypothetical protein
MSDIYLLGLIWILGPLVGIAAANHQGFDRVSGAIGGLLLGPVFALGLFWVSPTKQRCPHCTEWVPKDARVCSHCQRDLPQPPAPRQIATSSAARRGR